MTFRIPISCNLILFFIGMLGVGVTTDWNLWAMFWTWVASVHITYKFTSEDD